MKLKNSNDNLSLKMLLPVMYAVTVLLVIIRTFQLTRYIDSETGFLTGGGILNAVFYIIVAAAVVFFTAVAFMSSESKKIELASVNDKSCAIASAVFGAALICDSIVSMKDSLIIFDDMYLSSLSNTAEIFKQLMATGTLPYALQSVFALTSAVYMRILYKSFSKGSLAAHNHKYLALAPVVWSAFKIITRFVKQISYIKVSDLFLELIMLAFMILFFVAFAQVVSGVYSDDSRWRITALGLGGAMMSFSINIPRLVLTVFADSYVNCEYPFNIADTAFAVFAVVVVISTVKAVAAKNEKA